MKKMTNFRWIICALLFFATTVNYLDRQVLSLTWDDFIKPEFHWGDREYGIITGYFSLIYAVCNLFAGKFVDWMGTKKGYLWAIFIWSLAACLHAGCGWATALCVDGVGSVAALRAVEAGSAAALAIASVSAWLFLACRCLLALGEAGNFPAAIKVTAEYFPKKDRALATAVFNTGSSVGALAAPLLIPPLAKSFGWEMAFVIIGALGFVWMGFWQFLYKRPGENPRVNAEELAYICQDEGAAAEQSAAPKDETTIPFWKCFGYRQTWSLLWGRFTTDGVWWFLLFWAPSYFKNQGAPMTTLRGQLLIMTLYAIVTFVSIFGGYLPKLFVEKRGMEPYSGRMLAMFLFACVPLLALGVQPLAGVSLWIPAVLIGCVGAGHQSWSANVYSVVGDMFPKSTVATLTGIASCAAGLGSFLVNRCAGELFTFSEAQGAAFTFLGFAGKDAGYMILFSYCAIAYLAAWIGMKALVPHYRKVEA